MIRLILPYQCLLCKCRSDQDQDLCSYCERSLLVPKIRCPQCALILEETATRICGHCLKSSPAFDRAVVAADYMSETAYLLHQFKFYHRFAEGKILAILLSKALKASYQNLPWPELIVPVPLHYKRLFSRGFNQALLLAKNLHFPIKIDHHLLKKPHNSPTQVGLSAEQRKRNLRGVFKLTKPVADLHIALVDDVITTGSTLQAIAYELKKAGARQVDVWAALRAQTHH